MTPSSRCEAVAVFSDARELRRVEDLLALRETALGLGADMRLDRRAFGQRIVRQARFAELERQRTAPRDLHGVAAAPRECRQRARAISAGDRRYCASVYRRARPGSVSCAPSEMQTRASCDSKSLAARKRTSLVATTGMPVFWLKRHGLGDQRFVVGAPQALQLEVVAIAEQRLPLARQRQRIGVAAVGEARDPRRLRRTRRARSVPRWFPRRASFDRAAARRDPGPRARRA